MKRNLKSRGRTLATVQVTTPLRSSEPSPQAPSGAAATAEPIAIRGPDTDPVQLLAMLHDGIGAVLANVDQSRRLMARLHTYRLLFPERYGHLAAFTEGVDQPTEEQAAEYLAKADAAFGAR